MRTEDGYIIHKCLNGDSAAFGLLVDKYREGIYGLAYSKLSNFHDAEDVTQEVFIKAYEKLRTLRRYDSFLAWLYSITTNLCKDSIRRRSRRPDRDFIEDKEPQTLSILSIDSYRRENELESVREALDSLPKLYRQVLILRYLSGMSNVEIASLLGTSSNNIRQRLWRARSRLKEEMLAMVDSTLGEQRLKAGFTFNILEQIKRMRINPLPRTSALPWGLSLATGIIIAVLSIGSKLNLPIFPIPPVNPERASESEMAEVGEMPVEMLRMSLIPAAFGREGDNHTDGLQPPDLQNSILMAPQGEGGTIPDKPSIQIGKGSIRGMAYSPDGKVLAVGTTLGIKLYDSGNLNEIGLLQEDTCSIGKLAFSPDGQTLAVSVSDKIQLWDWQAKRQIGSVQGGSNIDFSPDGHILAVSGASNDNVIRLWDVQEMSQIGILEGHTGYIRDIAFTPDGKTMASMGYDAVRLWSIQGQEQIGTIEDGGCGVIAISPDGKTLASGGEKNNEGSLLLWDIQGQNMIGSLKGHNSLVTSVAYGPDGKILVSGSSDKTIRIWDVQEREQIGLLQGDETALASYIVFNPDGKTFATTSDSQRIRIWDVQEQKQVGIIDGFMPWVLAVAFSPDGNILACDNNAMITFWDVRDQKQIGNSILPEENWFLGELAFSPDGKTLAAGDYSGFISLIDAQEQKRIGLLKGHTKGILSLAFSPDSELLASGSGDMSLWLWDVEQQKDIEVFRCGSQTISVAFSPDGKTLACGVGGECTIRMWDVETKKQISNLNTPGMPVTSIAFSPDGEILASGSRGSIRFWDLANEKLLGTALPADNGIVWKLMFSPDGKWLASQSDSGHCRVWDPKTRKQLASLEAHKGDTLSMSFSPDGKWLATGGEDGTILFWELNIPVEGKSVEPKGKLPGTWGKVKQTELYQNYPNPFNPETWIPFRLAQDTDVNFRIYNTSGLLIKEIELGHRQAGIYSNKGEAAYWDGRNEAGELAVSGIYFYSMEAAGVSNLRKMVMIR